MRSPASRSPASRSPASRSPASSHFRACRFASGVVAAALTSFLVACGGAGEPPGPPSLAYEVPVDPTATYVQADTAEVSVDAGGQMIDVTVASRATMEMSFAPAEGGGVRVTVLMTDLDATASNPMGPPQNVSEDAIDGELVFTLSPTGHGTLVSSPELDDEARSFVSPSVIAATFFPRVPGRAVVAGDSWTDTVSIDADEGDSTIEAVSVITYTAVGDTTVMGANYLKVELTADDERLVEGNQMGMDMSQELSGSSEGWFLWDPVRRLPAEIVIESEADGTMEVSAAPFPLAISAEGTTRITLQPPGGGM